MTLEVMVGSWILISVLREAMEVFFFEVFDVLYILKRSTLLAGVEMESGEEAR